MTWARLDDGFGEHPKVVGLSDAAYRLHVNAICYCARNLTDGAIPMGAVRTLGRAGKPVSELVECGLWAATATGYVIHDYLDYNPSREEVAEMQSRRTEAARVAGNASAAARQRKRNDRVNDPFNDWPTDFNPVPDPVPQPLTPTEETSVSSSGVVAQAPKPPRRTRAGIEVMTDEQFADLAGKYGSEFVRGKLEYGRNRQDWETKHKSEYLTVKRWCEQDTGQGSPGVDTLTKSDPDARRRKFLGGSLGALVRYE